MRKVNLRDAGDVVVEDEVQIVEVEPVKPIDNKKVRIKLAENHSCSIGGERFYLVKDKCYSVPENVKIILAEARLLLPL